MIFNSIKTGRRRFIKSIYKESLPLKYRRFYELIHAKTVQMMMTSFISTNNSSQVQQRMNKIDLIPRDYFQRSKQDLPCKNDYTQYVKI